MDLDWGLVGGNMVTWSRRWMDAGCIDNAWMIIIYLNKYSIILIINVLCGSVLGLGWWQRGDLVEEVDGCWMH